MHRLIERSYPREVDVLIVVSLDDPESLGIDIIADMNNFRSQGLAVGIMSLLEEGRRKRHRNTRLIEAAFNYGVEIMGPRDSCKACTTIVYSTEIFTPSSLRGNISTSFIAFVVDDAEKFLSMDYLPTINRYIENYSSTPAFLLATNKSNHALLKSVCASNKVWEWSFHNSRPFNIVSKPEGNRDCTWVGAASGSMSKELMGELKHLAEYYAEDGDVKLCLRSSLPGPLQSPRGEPEAILGFPFVPKTREDYVASLDAFIVTEAALKGSTWRADIYACMELLVPLLLPIRLKPYFEDAAEYYELSPSEVPLGTLKSNTSGFDAQDFAESRSFVAGRTRWSEIGITHDSSTKTGLGDSAITSLLDGKASAATSTGGRVCFVTSNGAGMGHLTRLLAVARRLDGDVTSTFISMSQACGVVAEYGFGFEYIPSRGDLGCNGPEWNRYFNRKFIEALDRAKPDVVVFDGTWPYQGIAAAVESYDATFVWMRRGMWREETPSTSLVRNNSFHSVISPGDVAESYDRGATRRALGSLNVDPIVVLDKNEILDRHEARSALGIDLEANVMLITLGAGNINKIDDDVDSVIRAAQSLDEPWEIVITNPLIADGAPRADNIQSISVYPLARYAKAFDFVISATGYNSFHEWIAYGVPALWIANGNTITDDQIGRAIYAHEHGLGFAAGPGATMGIEEAIHKLADREIRASICLALASRSFENGARQAARHLSTLAKDQIK